MMLFIVLFMGFSTSESVDDSQLLPFRGFFVMLCKLVLTFALAEIEASLQQFGVERFLISQGLEVVNL